MVGHEWGERCQKLVGMWLAVHAVYDACNVGMGIVLKRAANVLPYPALVYGIDEHAAEHSPTSFIAQHITQWRNIGCDGMAVIHSRVGSSAHYAGNAASVAPECLGCSHEVAVNFYHIDKPSCQCTIHHRH